MLKRGRIALGLSLALAGCSTEPPRHVDEPEAFNWSADGGTNRAAQKIQSVQHLPSPPKLAPPASNAVPIAAPAVIPAAVLPRTNLFSETWIPLGRWSRENRVGSLRRTALAPAATFALTTSNGVLTIQANSRVARWNGLELFFGFEPQLVDDQPFVHALDLKKNIEPLILASNVPEKSGAVIAIDAGHGGSQTGTRSVVDGGYEKEFTLDWARRVAALLESNGCQVVLTRMSDSEIPLSNRVEFVEQHQADLFVSLHFNSAAPNEEQAGLETFCLTPVGMPSTLKREYDDNPARVFPNNTFDAANLQWAVRFHRAVLQAGGMIDRGVRRARFMDVLRGQNRPAVLIEGGYLSNPEEARRIADPAYRQKLAEGVVTALIPLIGNRRIEAANPKPETNAPTAVPRPAAPESAGSNSAALTAPLH